ncbi:MAG TPA: FAD-binding oxidoreductase [Ktedonobacterales bacterium]|nr:FAD-binding oxidoreductase [Ktedonobacterales bacterium]
MDVTAQALETALAQLSPHARPADDGDIVAGVRPGFVVEPESEEQVAAVLRYANESGLAVIPRGGGTQLTMGAPPHRADIILSMTRMNQIIEYAPHDLTVTAQAGLRLADLQQALGEGHQWLALDPLLEANATLGGLISTNATGARRLRHGGVRDQIIGVRVALADGTIARGGGKVVKNVAGYDLPKLYTGALGTLGVVLSASFRLYPLASASATTVLTSESLPTLTAVASRIVGRQVTPTALDIFSPEANGAPYQLAARFESGAPASIESQTRTVSTPPVTEGELTATTLSGADEARFWADGAARWRTPLSPEDNTRATATIKASLLLTEVAAWLAALEAARAKGDVAAHWQAHVGHGIIAARLTATPDALAQTIKALRRAAIERRGSLVITELPPALYGSVDPWGPIPALAVMRRLKERFDPNGILNPGRFVGGI